MRRETRRYVIRSRWCGPLSLIFLLWSGLLAYSMLIDSRFMPLVYSLLIILAMLLIQTIYVAVYVEE
jgi:hypothetical protein